MDMAKPKIRFKGYTDEWEQRKLGDDLVSIHTGTNLLGSITNTGMPLIKMGNIQRGYFDTSKVEFLAENEQPDKADIVNYGDFFFNTRNTLELVGKGATWMKNSGEYAFNSNIARFELRNLDTIFFNYLYNTDYMTKQIHARAMGTTSVAAIYPSTLDSVEYLAPCMKEQQKIGAYFKQLDHLITLHQRKAICTKNVRNNHILSIFLWERAVFMGKMILYHGSPNEMIHPIYGLGEDKHDYGRGFYLTANIELAKEWAVCRPDQSNGWVHKYELVTDDLRILDFQQLNVLSWLAELMKHREASDSKRYRVLAVKFIDKYGIDTDGYDVIKGWRADASYFYIAKAFVRDEIDVDILEELLFLGDLGIQYCIKSEKGYANLHELESELLPVSFADFNDKYNERDIAARENMRKLIDSDDNKVTKVFSTLI